MSDGAYNYEYDDEGNRVKRTKISSGEIDRYSWDYRNRLTGIVTKDAANNVLKTVGYEYDVDDQRVSKQLTVNSGQLTVTSRENYYLDRNQIAFVTDGNGDKTFHYLYGLDVDAVLAQDNLAVNSQLSTVNYSGMVWSLADRLGSIDLLTDKDGVVVDKRSFDSFGRSISQSNPTVSFRYGYTARELDLESGLHYYRARYYDAGVGRFISVDPIGFDAGDTNLYRYVSNNSVNLTDPTGLLKLYEGNPILEGLEAANTLLSSGFGPFSIFGGKSASSGLFQPAIDALKTNELVRKLDLKVEFDAGEKYGDAAAEFYATKFNDPDVPLWQKPFYFAGGTFASLWTTKTSDATFAVLSTAWTGAKDVKKLGEWTEKKIPQLKLGGAFNGLTRFETAVDSKINKATSVGKNTWNNINQNLSSMWEGINSRVDKTRKIDINYAWRRENLSDNQPVMYSLETLGEQILENKFSTIASERINKSGFTTILDHTADVAHGLAGEADRNARTVRIYYANNFSPQQAISTLVHESVHVERRTKGIRRNSQYEEYLAAVREEIYKNNGKRPSFEKRIEIWDDIRINDAYKDLDELKDPTRNIRNR